MVSNRTFFFGRKWHLDLNGAFGHGRKWHLESNGAFGRGKKWHLELNGGFGHWKKCHLDSNGDNSFYNANTREIKLLLSHTESQNDTEFIW